MTSFTVSILLFNVLFFFLRRFVLCIIAFRLNLFLFSQLYRSSPHTHNAHTLSYSFIPPQLIDFSSGFFWRLFLILMILFSFHTSSTQFMCHTLARVHAFIFLCFHMYFLSFIHWFSFYVMCYRFVLQLFFLLLSYNRWFHSKSRKTKRYKICRQKRAITRRQNETEPH